MSDEFDIAFPPDRPQPVAKRERQAMEQSAVRQAIVECLEGGAPRLMGWLDKIESEKGAKAAFDSFLKLLEFGQPKLQRIVVEDPNGNAPQLPVINVSFGQPIKVVNIEDEHGG